MRHLGCLELLYFVFMKQMCRRDVAESVIAEKARDVGFPCTSKSTVQSGVGNVTVHSHETDQLLYIVLSPTDRSLNPFWNLWECFSWSYTVIVNHAIPPLIFGIQ